MTKPIITDADKYKAAAREAAIRLSVYPKRVRDKKMTQAQADWEIAVMEAIAQDYLIRLNGSH